MPYLFTDDREKNNYYAVSRSVPASFSPRAKAVWEQLPDWVVIVKTTEGHLLVTNDTMDLYRYCEWDLVEPMPWKVESWEELEKRLLLIGQEG